MWNLFELVKCRYILWNFTFCHIFFSVLGNCDFNLWFDALNFVSMKNPQCFCIMSPSSHPDICAVTSSFEFRNKAVKLFLLTYTGFNLTGVIWSLASLQILMWWLLLQLNVWRLTSALGFFNLASATLFSLSFSSLSSLLNHWDTF